MTITASLLTTEDNSFLIKSFHLLIENIMMNFLWKCGRRTVSFFFPLPCSPNWVRVRKEEAVKLCPVFCTEQQRRQKKQELALVTVITLWLYNSIIFPGLINIHLQHLNHLHSRSCRLKISHLKHASDYDDNQKSDLSRKPLYTMMIYIHMCIKGTYGKANVHLLSHIYSEAEL